MDQRLFIAIALSMLVLIGYYIVFPPPQPPPPTEEGTAGKQEAPATGTQGISPGPAMAPSPGTPAVSATPAPGVPGGTGASGMSTEEAPSRIIEVNTPLYTAYFDTRGGRMTGMHLKAYKVNKTNISWGDVLPPLKQWLDNGPVDLEALVDMAPLPDPDGITPFEMMFVGEESMTRRFRSIGYESDRDSLRIAGANGAPQSLTLTASTREGLTVQKTFTFHPDSYRIDYKLALINYGQAPKLMRVATLFGEGPEGAKAGQGFGSHVGPIWMEEGDVSTEDPDDIGPLLQVRNSDWIGITDSYFISVAKAVGPVSHGFFNSREFQDGKNSVWTNPFGFELPQVELQPGKMVMGEFQTYNGPKKVEELERFGSGLEESVVMPDLAAFLRLDVLAWPMLALLRWFYGYTGNYGVAIILLTIVVRVLIFPVTYKGSVAMKRMQKLQPRMKTLKEKYKNDKERLNKEMMEMYKKHKMNPLGGCLPIAFQIPVFLALYSALLVAIELRHQPFIFWITDLSALDGLYILPLMMGGSMLVQQRLMPTSLDPTQAKLMMWMPVVFMFFMLSFPSGLVLYWFVSNILSIGQQVVINRIKVPEPEE